MFSTTLTLALALVASDPAPEQVRPPAASLDYCAQPTARTAPEFADDADETAQAETLLVRAGIGIAASQPDPDTCGQAFRQGEDLFQRTLDRHLANVGRGVERRRASDPAISAVQARIETQWARDQAGRLAYSELQTDDRTGARFWAQRLATAHAVLTDAGSTALMRDLLTRFDWIDSHRFGGTVSSHAWILVQHADDHPDFQRLALDRMQGHLDDGGVRTRDYAYLWDRVAVNQGQPQRYGTQPADVCNADGTLDFKPMEDPDRVDDRRRSVGLGPARDDLARMARERCRMGR